jgi:DNA-binding MarR family transcriptional regulator
MSPGALLNQTLVTSGTMTNRIDRLTERSLVRREADPNDRRGVLVVLTETGVDTVDAALTDLLDREQELLAGLTDRQREVLAATLRDLVAPFDNPA